jgi:hypothetical protein
MGAHGANGRPALRAKRPVATPTARAGAAFLVGAGVAVAVLQVLQQAVAQFNPRPAISVLITVAVALASLALERLRARKQDRQAKQARERDLERSLICWPPPLLSEVDRYEVGVFPRRRLPPGEDDAYIPRTVDERLTAAIAASPFVLVYGPARSGKSRTALESAIKALPDTVVIAPAGSEGLHELLDLDPPIQPRASQAVLWLDSLERYDDGIDPLMFETFDDLDTPVTIVATVRTDDYEKLLKASGERGDAARAVAARARAFELDVGLDDQELAAAERLYPGEDFTHGPGPRFASSGKEEVDPPKTERTERREVDPPETPTLRDPLFSLPAAGAIAALLLVALVALLTSFTKPEPPSLGEQADAIKSDAAKHGLTLVQQTKVDFHGDPSYLFAFQATSFRARLGSGPPPPSDVIEIWDPVRGKLVRRFRFQPSEPRAEYQYRFSGDLNGNGEGELIGGYGFQNDGSSLALLPFIVFWSDADRAYKIVSLEPDPPSLSRHVHADAAGAALDDLYQRPIVLTDPRDKLELHGYRVQDFAVIKSPARIVTALAVRSRTSTITGRVELQASIPLLSGGQPALLRCIPTGTRHTLMTTWSPARLLYLQIPEVWGPFIKTKDCLPQG